MSIFIAFFFFSLIFFNKFFFSFFSACEAQTGPATTSFFIFFYFGHKHKFFDCAFVCLTSFFIYVCIYFTEEGEQVKHLRLHTAAEI